MGKLVRLDKYLADCGGGTRSQVKKYIGWGRVSVDGKTIRTPEFKLDPESAQVLLDGKSMKSGPEFIYYLLHKPAGCVSATEDSRDKTVMDYVPDDFGRRELFPVGRLDKDTEGLLLITDDGALAHALLSPARHVDKTYYVEMSGRFDEVKAGALEQGVEIGEKNPAKGKAVLLEAGEEKSSLNLTIQEGKFHQVKRMIHAIGGEVTYLRRISMGSLKLPADLGPGEGRLLTDAELAALKKEV